MERTKQIFHTLIVVAIILTLGTSSLFAEGEKININTATVEELTQLKQVGEKTAQQIVAYREQNGPFKEAKDITQVKGVGPKTWELNQDRITVGKD